MPFESEAQRRFMFAKHPKIAKEFAEATPKGADLPEHVKHSMAEGGTIENDAKNVGNSMPDLESSPEAFDATMKQENVTHENTVHDSDAVRSYLASKFHHLLHPEESAKMAEGGPVMRSELEHQEPNAMMARPMAEGGYPHVTFLENETPEKVQETVHLEPRKPMPTTTTETGEKENPPHMAEGGVSHDDKLKAIYKAMGMKGYADGGPAIPTSIDNPQGLPSPTDPTYWDQIKAALTKIGAPITKPAGAVSEMASTITPTIAPATISAVNNLTGVSLPVPPSLPPKTEGLGAPVPLSTPAPTTPLPTMAPASKPELGGTPATADLKNMFNQDTSKLTQGVTAEDRQALAGKMGEQQRGLGSIAAEALAGLGDALAAKGGREQHALKDIFGLQKQQRDEALMNFDKARQDRLEKLDLQTKMGNNTIQKLAAQDAYGVDEHLNKVLGAPPGTAHKDLPLYMQMKTAEIAQNEKDTDLYMKAHKQAADEIEAAEKSAGMFHVKPSPAQTQAAGAKLADQYYHRAKGHVLFQPSDGQKAVWIPAQNMQKAQQMDPHGQIIP